jgi:two-component system, NarL family, nitrate/nitrite response regulator NarL
MQKAECPSRIAIVDDHPIFRYGLRKLLESQADMCVVGETALGGEAVDLARELKPDVLLLDAGSPGEAGLGVLRLVASPPLAIRTLMLAGEVEKTSTLDALRLGASGIVLKHSSQGVLLASIRKVLAGEYWLGSESLPFLIEALRASKDSAPISTSFEELGLTAREVDIIAKVAAGASNRDVARQFCISERTVKHHLTHVYEKLGVSSRLELAVFARDRHLVSLRQSTSVRARNSEKWKRIDNVVTAHVS